MDIRVDRRPWLVSKLASPTKPPASRSLDGENHAWVRDQARQRLSKLVRALLLSLEQPPVFDGDGGLSSESRQQGDVLWLERSSFGTADHDGAKFAAFADQRHGEDGTVSMPDRKFPAQRELVAGVLYVGEVDRLQIADGAASHRGAVQRHRFWAPKPIGFAKRSGMAIS